MGNVKAMKASLVLLAGLVLSALMPPGHGGSEGFSVAVAVMTNVIFLAPGVYLTMSLASPNGASALRRALASSVAPVVLLIHTGTLAAPAVMERTLAEPGFAVAMGYNAFKTAFVFPHVCNSHGIPWWLANLVIVLLPYLYGDHPRLLRGLIAILAVAGAALAWAPHLDRSNEIWTNTISDLFIGYYLWAGLISVLALLFVFVAIFGRARPINIVKWLQAEEDLFNRASGKH